MTLKTRGGKGPKNLAYKFEGSGSGLGSYFILF